MLRTHGVTLAPGAGQGPAERLADAMVRAVAYQLPTAAPELARAARDPAAGITLTFTFTFPSKGAIARATPDNPTMSISAGTVHV
jgi:hypothetical protein